jgi:membrane fusion protein, multidrug efflux system
MLAVAAMVAVAAAALSISRVFVEKSASRQEVAKQTVQLKTPVVAAVTEVQNVPIILRGIGTVQAFDSVTVKARVDGNIVKVGFREGQSVKQGDLLFQIDPRPYQAQLDQAQANKAKDEAALAEARLDLARYEKLLPDQLAVTRQQYDAQHALVDEDIAAVGVDQAQINTAKLNLTYAAVTSPVDGITGVRLVDLGNLVLASAATPLVVVTQIKPIYVTFTIAERELDRVRKAMSGHSLTVLAYDGEDEKQLSQGQLNLINNSVDQNTGTVTLKAEFANEEAALWPGEFVNAHLVVGNVANGITVPAGAVLMGPSGPFVYRINSNSTIEPISVAINQVENGRALISGNGLKGGEQVVASGQSDLMPGATVAVKSTSPSEMSEKEQEIGPEGVGTTGLTTAPPGIPPGVTPR